MGLALRENQMTPASTERWLVAAVRNGDDAAFEELFSRYRSRITAFVVAAVGDHGRAEDITQEVFISALRRLRETDRPISFKPWIYEIARNACIDEFRRRRRATEVSLDRDDDPAGTELQIASPYPTPDQVAERREQLRDLKGAFGCLSATHHRILVMRELEGLSYSEIEQRLDMSRAMVESTLFRARKRLNEEFRDLESGRRCENVRAVIDRSQMRSMHSLGIRERRQVVRHLSHCHACRQHAWTAGFDASSLGRHGLADKIAALLPIGWWRARRGGGSHGHGGGSHGGWLGGRRPSILAGRFSARLARYSDPASQLPLGRAAAAVTALAVAAAGGGYVAAGSGSKTVPPPANAAAVVPAAAVAPVPPVARVTRHAVRHPAARPVTTQTKHIKAHHGRNAATARGSGPQSHRAAPGARQALPIAQSPAARPVSPPPSAASSAPAPAAAAPHQGSGGGGVVQQVLGGAVKQVVSLPSAQSVQNVTAPMVNAVQQLPAVGNSASAPNVPAAAQGAAQAAGQAVNTVTGQALQAVGGATHAPVPGGH